MFFGNEAKVRDGVMTRVLGYEVEQLRSPVQQTLDVRTGLRAGMQTGHKAGQECEQHGILVGVGQGGRFFEQKPG